MAISDQNQEHAPEVDATNARQGRWGRHMLWVLLIGLGLAFMVLFGTWAMQSSDLQRADETSGPAATETPLAGG